MGTETPTPPTNALYFGDINEKFLETLWRGPERLVLSSEGGCIYCMLAGVDYLKAHPLLLVATGHCWSAAVPILACATTRLATPNTSFLLHQSSLTTSEQRPREVSAESKEMQALDRKYMSLLEKRTKKKAKFWSDLCESHTYLSATEAKRYGLIDKILRA